MNDLLIGLLSGAILASGTFTLRSWRRKNRLKQPWLNQPNQSEQLLQEKLELSQQLEQRQSRIQTLRQELTEQQQQLQIQQQQLADQQQQLEAEQARCKLLTQERDKAWKEAEQILDSDQAEAQEQQAKLKALEQERHDLTGQITQLEQELANTKGRLAAQAHSLEEAQARLQTGTIGQERFSQAIAKLLPNITFLRDSMEFMLQEPPHRLNALLGSLRALSDGSLIQNHHQNGIKVIKVHATDNKWSEFHVPNANMMRVYFHKSKAGDRYQVLVTEKKDPKTQGKNHAWLKSQSVS